MPATVSVVIINYHGEPFIQECLESVLRQSQPSHEIIVVDNASRDASPELVRTLYPHVRLLALSQNTGYAAGCNRGIEESSGELVAILNNDVILDSRWLETLLQQDSRPWDCWASRIVFASQPDRVDSAGDGMAVVGAAYKIGHGESVDRHQQPREVFGPCGAAALYRRSLLRAVGGFDDDFFLIYEDADLNMRARLLGFRCLYVPQAVARHRVNASIRTFSHSYVFYGHRNSEYVFWKNMPVRLLMLYLPERCLFDLLSFAYFLLRGRGGSFLRAKYDFLRNFPRTLNKRRTIQQSRRLTDPEFRRLLDRNWLRHRRKAVVNP